MAYTNMMSFDLGFRDVTDANAPIQMMSFGGVLYDAATVDEPSDVAMNHFITKLQDHVDFKNLSPVMRTFRLVSDTVPSDLGMR